MLLTIPLDKYTHEYVLFMEKKKNIILNNSQFTKIVYSPKNITMNGLYIFVQFDVLQKNANKNKEPFFILNENSVIVDKIYKIEEDLLNNYLHYFNIDKKKSYAIRHFFYNNYLKLYEKKEKLTHICILRISGIWETIDEIGITYKIEPFVI